MTNIESKNQLFAKLMILLGREPKIGPVNLLITPITKTTQPIIINILAKLCIPALSLYYNQYH